MRSIHKSWQNRRPGFTRRVRWYNPDDSDFNGTIRLNFEDEYGQQNVYYKTLEEAQAEFDAFKADELNTLEIREGR
jgi:hypothetical protein